MIDYANHQLNMAPSEKAIPMSSDQVYAVESLPFGGVIAFDTQFAYLYLDNRRRCVEAVKLRNSIIMTAACCVDQLPTDFDKTPQKGILRMLVGTEQGELYMVAFNLEKIWQLLYSSQKLSAVQEDAAMNEESQIMIVEFLGARLSACSDLLYLGGNDSRLFYSSTAGDSYVLSVKSEEGEKDEGINPSFNTELAMNDRPYVRIVEEYQSLAPIIGLEMRRNF